MFTPEIDSMPPLVDGPPSFIPPPHGATNGGQPGFYDAFPGARGGYQPNSSWVPPQSTPYPTQQQLPGGWPASPPASAPGWTYGNYPPAGTPVWGPPPAVAPSYNPWGAPQTPAGTWGVASPTSPWGAQPQTPGGYNPFPGYGPAGGGSAPGTPYGGGQMPGTPFESSVGQPITGGWFGAAGGGGGGAVEGAGWVGGGSWGVPVYKEQKKKKKSDHRHGHGHGYDYSYDDALHRSSSMRRSNSQGPPARRQSLQRSASWGNAAGVSFPGWYGGGGGGGGGGSGPSTPGYAQGDLFDEHNLARRPRDWRAAFSVKPGIASYIPKLGGNRSTVQEYNDPVRRHLHPLLAYDPANPPIYYDMRAESFSEPDVDFLNLRRPHNRIDFAQLALQPTCAFMRIYHPRFPWYIDIHQMHPNGVTVYDIFSQMNRQLQTPIHGRHFWNDELGEAERTAITLAFQERVREDKGRLVPRGILQVDYFGKKVVFEGLVRGPKGMWEMKVTKEDP